MAGVCASIIRSNDVSGNCEKNHPIIAQRAYPFLSLSIQGDITAMLYLQTTDYMALNRDRKELSTIYGV